MPGNQPRSDAFRRFGSLRNRQADILHCFGELQTARFPERPRQAIRPASVTGSTGRVVAEKSAAEVLRKSDIASSPVRRLLVFVVVVVFIMPLSYTLPFDKSSSKIKYESEKIDKPL